MIHIGNKSTEIDKLLTSFVGRSSKIKLVINNLSCLIYVSHYMYQSPIIQHNN